MRRQPKAGREFVGSNTKAKLRADARVAAHAVARNDADRLAQIARRARRAIKRDANVAYWEGRVAQAASGVGYRDALEYAKAKLEEARSKRTRFQTNWAKQQDKRDADELYQIAVRGREAKRSKLLRLTDNAIDNINELSKLAKRGQARIPSDDIPILTKIAIRAQLIVRARDLHLARHLKGDKSTRQMTMQEFLSTYKNMRMDADVDMLPDGSDSKALSSQN